MGLRGWEQVYGKGTHFSGTPWAVKRFSATSGGKFQIPQHLKLSADEYWGIRDLSPQELYNRQQTYDIAERQAQQQLEAQKSQLSLMRIQEQGLTQEATEHSSAMRRAFIIKAASIPISQGV